MEAERYPILKRICGKAGELILDNAAEFTSHGLEDAAKSGSFSVRFCPVRRPRYRAIGERAIKTTRQDLSDAVDDWAIANGRIGYNPFTHAKEERSAGKEPDGAENAKPDNCEGEG